MSKELRDLYAVTYASVKLRRSQGGQHLVPPTCGTQFYASRGLAHKISGLRPTRTWGVSTGFVLDDGVPQAARGVASLPARK